MNVALVKVSYYLVKGWDWEMNRGRFGSEGILNNLSYWQHVTNVADMQKNSKITLKRKISKKLSVARCLTGHFPQM
jgi:hypothetical protein